MAEKTETAVTQKALSEISQKLQDLTLELRDAGSPREKFELSAKLAEASRELTDGDIGLATAELDPRTFKHPNTFKLDPSTFNKVLDSGTGKSGKKYKSAVSGRYVTKKSGQKKRYKR